MKCISFTDLEQCHRLLSGALSLFSQCLPQRRLYLLFLQDEYLELARASCWHHHCMPPCLREARAKDQRKHVCRIPRLVPILALQIQHLHRSKKYQRRVANNFAGVIREIWKNSKGVDEELQGDP